MIVQPASCLCSPQKHISAPDLQRSEWIMWNLSNLGMFVEVQLIIVRITVFYQSFTDPVWLAAILHIFPKARRCKYLINSGLV